MKAGVVLLCGMMLSLAACSAPTNPIGPKTDTIPPSGAPGYLVSGSVTRTVVYEVTGTASTVELAWTAPDGLQRQTMGLPLPDTGASALRFQFPRGALVSVSVTNADTATPGRPDYGTVGCAIVINGQETTNQSVSSGGIGTTAACSMTVP